MTDYNLEDDRATDGTFGVKTFHLHEIPSFAAAPSAEVRAQSSRDALISLCRDFGVEYQPLVDDFDREHHGDPDGARTAALATSEGIVGTGSYLRDVGRLTTHDVVLARTDADGVVRTIGVLCTTGDGGHPTTAEALNAMLTESAGLNDVDGVGDWANQYGYDLVEEGPIVRQAYENVLSQDAELRDFLGEKYDMYLWGE